MTKDKESNPERRGKGFPKLKRKASDFLLSEEGKVSKERLLKLSAVIGAASLASGIFSDSVNADCTSHSNSVTLDRTYGGGGEWTATHSHHGSHSSHSSHGSGGGGGGGCFPAGTRINMEQGVKQIEDVGIGERVMSYDVNKEKFDVDEVEKIQSPVCKGIYVINDGLISVTDEHPFYVKKSDGRKGWAAIDPKAAIRQGSGGDEMMSLCEGDLLFSSQGEWIEVTDIRYIEGQIKTYNLRHVKKNNNFFANDLLVHNKMGM